jgi:hypothetical protein
LHFFVFMHSNVHFSYGQTSQYPTRRGSNGSAL